MLDGALSYYVYVLFDWRGVPRWIGKGKNDRIDDHERKSDRSNWMKNEFIEQTWNVLGEVPKLKIREYLTEAEAFESEIAFIKAIGRHPNGPLVNMTDGGDGVRGVSPERWGEIARKREANMGPQKRSDRAYQREAKIPPELRRLRAQMGIAGMSKEALRNRALMGASKLTAEQRRAKSIKGAAGRTLEQRIASAIKGAASITPERLRDRALRAAAKMPEGWHKAAMQVARSALDMSPEARRERARRAQASRTPQERSEIARKTWVSRRAKIKEVNLDL